MSLEPTLSERIAQWICELRYDQIPGRVLEKTRLQYLSVLAAVFAGARTQAGQAVLSVVRRLEPDGPCTLLPSGEKTGPLGALLGTCSLSMALDYDDYLWMGHTGHSAVLVPLVVGEFLKASWKDCLVASVVADEVEGRFGAACAIGPHNGQMWSYIHAFGAACAAAALLRLSPQQTTHAIGIALYQPPYPLLPGFFGPDSKLLTAALPSAQGVLAALCASEGMTGSARILDDPQGFLARIPFQSIPEMLGGLGEVWVTDTLAFKIYPGCAYLDCAVDAFFEVLEKYRRQEGRTLSPEQVREIVVRASLPTVIMEELSEKFALPGAITLVQVNFSLRRSLAAALLAGRLSGEELRESWLEKHRVELEGLARRVRIEHDWLYTVKLLEGISQAMEMGELAQSALGGIWLELPELVRKLRTAHGDGLKLSLGELGRYLRQVPARERQKFRRLLFSSLFSGSRKTRQKPFSLSFARFGDLRWNFGARLSLGLRSGARLEAERLTPRGSAGDPEQGKLVEEKFQREAREILDEESRRCIVEWVIDRRDGGIADLVELASSSCQSIDGEGCLTSGRRLRKL